MAGAELIVDRGPTAYPVKLYASIATLPANRMMKGKLDAERTQEPIELQDMHLLRRQPSEQLREKLNGELTWTYGLVSNSEALKPEWRDSHYPGFSETFLTA